MGSGCRSSAQSQLPVDALHLPVGGPDRHDEPVVAAAGAYAHRKPPMTGTHLPAAPGHGPAAPRRHAGTHLGGQVGADRQPEPESPANAPDADAVRSTARRVVTGGGV